MIIAGATGYVDGSSISSAPVGTFIWTRTFPITIYGPAVIPFLIVYLDNMLESIGDITASCDVSGVEVDGPVFSSRIQGGLLADGVNSLIAACMTLSPMVSDGYTQVCGCKINSSRVFLRSPLRKITVSLH